MKKEIKKTELEKVSNRLEGLFDLYPLILTDSKEVTLAMREGLARMFGDPHLRAFIENSIRFANQNLIRASTPEAQFAYKHRIDTLMQLLSMGKQHFIHFEMLRMNLSKKQQVKSDVESKLEVKTQ